MTERNAESEVRDALALSDLQQLKSALSRAPSVAMRPEFLVSAAAEGADFVAAVLEFGANLEAINGSGTSALAHAARRGKIDVVRLLLSRGAMPDGDVCAPTTPLMGAALHGKLEIAKLLVEAGADLDRDSLLTPTSALSVAESAAPFDQEARAEVARYLRSVGATKPWDEDRPDDFWEDAVGQLTILLAESALGVVSATPLHDELTEFARLVVRRCRHGWNQRFQTLFTSGLSEQGASYELALPLTAKWPLHRRALEQPRFRRPVDFLAAAGDRALTGVRIQHGDVLSREHPLVSGLEWPGEFDQWLVVDHATFAAKRAEFAASEIAEVRDTELPLVLLLVPHLEKKPLKPGDDARRKADAKALVKWEKPAASGGRNNLVVPLCYTPTWSAMSDPPGTWY